MTSKMEALRAMREARTKKHPGPARLRSAELKDEIQATIREPGPGVLPHEPYAKPADTRKQLLVRLSPDLIEEVKGICAEHGYKVEKFIERAIRVFIEHGEPENR